MDVIVERCAGLDVGKDEVVGCVRTPASSGRGRSSELRTFLTFTSGLEELADWLTVNGVTEVVMEATGQYWKPIWYLLEDREFDLKLVNAKHVKMVPGRKTDLADAAWLAQLLEHGLLAGSFVPPAPIRELRDLTRYRKRLIQTHTAECQRVQKVLKDAGIKLDSVASDVLGVSDGQCSKLSSPGNATRTRLPSWPRGNCARRSRCCATRCVAGSAITTPSCWVSSSITSTTSTERSPPSMSRSIE